MEFSIDYLWVLFGAFKVIIELFLLSSIIYLVLLFLKGTRGAPILAGFTIIGIFLTLIATLLKLEVVGWLIGQMWAFAALLILIIFQPEIRRAFAELGVRNTMLLKSKQKEKENIQILIDAIFFLADRKIGALIAVEREIGMRFLADSGVFVGAQMSKELLTTFFYPNTPLHDGGVILRRGVIHSAGCFFPLTQDMTLAKSLGTRHRAGVGVTEETDCVCIVISEETGTVSLAYRGRLARGLNRDRIERHLHNLLVKGKSSGLAGNVEKIKQAISEGDEGESI
ncbi:MAG: diadenylate cyclase CdaA [Lentisphaeraceae bacterium]|nr:diadenylate cyclase CdaA [Lentisphaeraceae bacterium]